VPTLNELAENYKNIADLMDDDTIEPEILSIALKTIEGDIATKSQNIAVILNSMDADINIIEAEIQRLKNRKDSIKNKHDWLKNHLQFHLENLKLDKVKTPLFTILLQKNPGSVKVLDEKAIPAKFLTIIPQTTVPDKKLIAAALKAGENVAGCEIVQEKSLRIR